MDQTFKRKVTCTCHRMHKNKFLKHKCKLHRHNIYYGNTKLNKLKKKTNKRKSNKNNTKKVHFNLPFFNSTKTYKRRKNPTPIPVKVKKVTSIGITDKTPVELTPFVESIKKIQQCNDSDNDDCREIKNYITLNVCSVNSSINEIMFYYNHLSKSAQKEVYHKVVEFSKTLD